MKNEDEGLINEGLIKIKTSNVTCTNSNYTINYVTDNTNSNISQEEVQYTYIGDSLKSLCEEENNVSFPIYLSDYKSITVPKGIRRSLKRLPKGILRKIDNDIELALEKCFLFISNLTYSVFREDDYWKGLSSEILHSQLRKGLDNTYVYKDVIKALSYSTNSTMPIIECRKNQEGRDSYQENNYSKQYRLNQSFKNQNLENIDLKFEDSLNKRRTYHLTELSKLLKNTIGNNLLNVYPKIKLPSKEQIEARADVLVKSGYKNKKGKILTKLNSKSKSYYSNPENRTFVEENLKLYDYLVGNNFLLPKIGDFKSGGRVVDSFNLMPSWIRSMITIDSEAIVELDFKALHPNIAMSIYGGVDYQIAHEKVAKDLSRPVQEVKIAHLSFFNKRVKDMKKSLLFNYYYKSEKEILQRIIDDKKSNTHKITSQKLFKKEVEIMDSCIQELNKQEVYVLYVYDALYCKDSQKNIVTEVMNNTLAKYSIKSIVG